MTTITRETVNNVKTIQEATTIVNAALNHEPETLKSVSIFVWSDKVAGVEVKVSRVETNDN